MPQYIYDYFRTISMGRKAQKAWSGLSPSRNPVHLRLWGLSFPSVESQLEPLQFETGTGQTQSPSSLGPKVRIQTHGSPKNASWEIVTTGKKEREVTDKAAGAMSLVLVSNQITPPVYCN